MKDTIGIDVSKDRLDAYSLATQSHLSFDNSAAGIARLIRWMEGQDGAAGQDSPLVVFEPSGRYHARLERALSRAGLAAHKVNPLHARRFAEAAGRLAKTDRIDAALLARMGAAMALQPQPADSENLHELKALLSAQRSLITARASEKTRAGETDHTVLQRQIAARIRLLDRQINELGERIEALIAQDPQLARRVEVLASIPGIGRATACAIVIDMPELGSLTRARAAALAGLAPMVRESGRGRGQARIRGGRLALRKALYMPALVAMRRNETMRLKASRLKSNGKPAKVIVTAIMRNLILLANTLLAEDRKWQPIPP